MILNNKNLIQKIIFIGISVIIHALILSYLNIPSIKEEQITPQKSINLSFIEQPPIIEEEPSLESLLSEQILESQDIIANEPNTDALIPVEQPNLVAPTKINKQIKKVTNTKNDIKENTSSILTNENQEKLIDKMIPKDLEEKPAFSPSRNIHINQKLKDFTYSQYFESWKSKVERVGTLNYPSEASNEIFNTLTLSVILNSDGTIKEMKILRSSGNSKIDQAAKNIVNLSAPFAAFTPSMKQEIDTLEISKTWNFKK